MSQQSSEFSQVIALDELPKDGRRFELEASEAERDAVANRLGVLSVDGLKGEVRITANKKRFDVSGSVTARLKRECVASLEEMEEAIDEAFEIAFLREASPSTEEEEISLETPEVYDAAEIDLGDLLVQQVSLAMDPFPRKPGVTSLAADYGVADDPSPFAQALAQAAKREENQ